MASRSIPSQIAIGSRVVPHKPLLLALWAALVGASPARVAAAPADPPVIVKTVTVDRIVAADGGYTTLLHVERLATNAGAAHNIAQQTVEYSDSMETAEIEEAFTRKADGRILTVDRTQIFP
jgi:hypothetical protein